MIDTIVYGISRHIQNALNNSKLAVCVCVSSVTHMYAVSLDKPAQADMHRHVVRDSFDVSSV